MTHRHRPRGLISPSPSRSIYAGTRGTLTPPPSMEMEAVKRFYLLVGRFYHQCRSNLGLSVICCCGGSSKFHTTVIVSVKAKTVSGGKGSARSLDGTSTLVSNHAGQGRPSIFNAYLDEVLTHSSIFIAYQRKRSWDSSRPSVLVE